MSHRIHGNHHQHAHERHFTEHEWASFLESKGYILEMLPESHWEHVNSKHWAGKYNVFKMVENVKTLTKVDEHGNEQL